jgi:hypothetical protein
MDKPHEVETIPAEEVAAALGTSFEVLKAMILNHTIPIGGVGHKEGSSRDRVIIVRKLWEKWLAGELGGYR